MSYQPPPYGSVIPINPDTRPLPEGWIQQYDQNYNTWFYVQTNAKPPITRWTHPLGPVPQYTPPSNNPYSNDMRAFASQPELGRPAPPYEFAEERGRGGGGGGSGSGMSTAMKLGAAGLVGAIASSQLGGHGHHGRRRSRSHHRRERRHRRHRRGSTGGLGGPLLAGGAGLLGGAMLAGALGGEGHGFFGGEESDSD